MATLKQRLHKKNSSGTYDTVYLETSASMVLMANGNTAETEINNKLPIDGSKPITGQVLGVYGGYGRINVGSNMVQIEHLSDPNNLHNRTLLAISDTAELASSIRIMQMRGYDEDGDGVDEGHTTLEYKLYGHHNYPPASVIQAGTFAGRVNANAEAAETLNALTLRNIYAKTTDMTAGSTELATGAICLIYE